MKIGSNTTKNRRFMTYFHGEPLLKSMGWQFCEKAPSQCVLYIYIYILIFYFLRRFKTAIRIGWPYEVVYRIHFGDGSIRNCRYNVLKWLKSYSSSFLHKDRAPNPLKGTIFPSFWFYLISPLFFAILGSFFLLSLSPFIWCQNI